MKRHLLSLLVLLATLTGTAQTIGEAFYVYRSDGMINTFFRSEVDSMAYSYYDTDSTFYDEIVTQVVYTPDSIYRIPLAMVDSIGFVTPETKYQPGVVKLEGTIRDYIIGSDVLTVFFRSDTPSSILPKIGDKLVTTEMSDTFLNGFLGQVDEEEEKEDTIAIHCSPIGIEEVYEQFYYSTEYTPPVNPNLTEWENYYAPGPFAFSLTNFLDTSFQPINCPFAFTSTFEVTIAPTFKSKGSIIVHPLRGVFINADINQRTFFTEDLAVSGEIEESKDISFIPEAIPQYPILPFLSIYGNVGVVFKVNGKLALEEHWNQYLNYNIHYEASYLPILPMPIPITTPKLTINNVRLTTEHHGQFMFDGYGAIGIFGEVAIVPWLLKSVAKAGVRAEGGLKLGGDVILYNSDAENSCISTSLYEALKARSLYLKSYCKVGLGAKFIGIGEGEITLFDKDWDLGRFKLVPDFSNTTLVRKNDTPSTLIAASSASGSTIVPCNLGFKLFEGKEEEKEGINGANTHNYWSLYGYPELYYDTFESQSPTKKHTVYPTVELFGLEMLATPSAELKAALKPITLDVEDITQTTAKTWGRIEGHEFMDESMEFGIGYTEIGVWGNTQGKTPIDASTMDADGTFSVEFSSLKPNTTYKYFAYLVINGEIYKGEEKEFITDGETQAYGVITEDGTHLTYYYDGKKNKRMGKIVCVPYSYSNSQTDAPIITTITFDASFANFCPNSTAGWFYNLENLTSIEHIEHLNTASVTNMRNMFNDCRSLKSLDLSGFNTSNVTNMATMFFRCSSLTSLDLSNFNTTNVTNMAEMFLSCSSLKTVNLKSFNTSKVTNMSQMFQGSRSLISLDLSSFNTSKVTDMYQMFLGCSSLTSLDLSNFNTANVTVFGNIFSGCSSLRTIYAGNWGRLKYASGLIFNGCNNLVGGQGTKIGQNFYGYDERGNPLYYYCAGNGSAAHIDGGKDNPGLFTAP